MFMQRMPFAGKGRKRVQGVFSASENRFAPCTYLAFIIGGRKAPEREDFPLNSKIKDESVDFLFQAILSLKTVEECYNFFEDLCTVPEIKAMSQRLLVAHMLSTKRVYSDIVAETGASTATISRVNRSLNYGCDGYELVFSRLDKKEGQE